MVFLQIQCVAGGTYTINSGAITLLMHGTDGDFWVLMNKQSIQISQSTYNDMQDFIDKIVIYSKPIVTKTDKVEDLQFTVRTANCLSNADVVYVHQLLEMTQTDLLKIKNMGRKSLNEIREKLADKYDAKLKGDQ